VVEKTPQVGLEVLVAADIVRTVALDAALINIAVLGAMVKVRTSTGWDFAVEVKGHWPWWRERRNPTPNEREKSMDDILTRFFQNIADRLHGPMNFRLVLQPLMAVFFAVLDGRKDARTGNPPYFWALFNDPEHRRDMLRSGWKSVGKIFAVAMILDAIYQFRVLSWFYPGEAVVVAFILAIVPYVLLRGLANRLTGTGGEGKEYERRKA